MNLDKKPEWFEMTENDNAPQIRKVTKSLPVSAIVAVALVLGSGAVIGQQGDEPSLAAIVLPELSLGDAQSKQQSTTVMRASSLKNPSIAQLPAGDNDDDEEEEDDEDEEEDDEDEEDEED